MLCRLPNPISGSSCLFLSGVPQSELRFVHSKESVPSLAAQLRESRPLPGRRRCARCTPDSLPLALPHPTPPPGEGYTFSAKYCPPHHATCPFVLGAVGNLVLLACRWGRECGVVGSAGGAVGARFAPCEKWDGWDGGRRGGQSGRGPEVQCVRACVSVRSGHWRAGPAWTSINCGKSRQGEVRDLPARPAGLVLARCREQPARAGRLQVRGLRAFSRARRFN